MSSTFYDLKAIRADIELALNQLSYDVVLHERGRVPYERDKKLDQSCYREISTCDIVVSVIGGRLGSTSSVDDHATISQMELRTAVEVDKQLFVFVDRNVATEYETWAKNPDATLDWAFVEDPKVFEFIKFVRDLPKNNPVQPFEIAHDITQLREQFAGLFQRLLSEREFKQELSLAGQLRSTATLLEKVVEKASSPPSGIVPDLLFANQAIFRSLRRTLNCPYRVFFTNRSELDAWLKAARRFKTVPPSSWDHDDMIEWIRSKENGLSDLLKMSVNVFDKDGNVRDMQPDEWNDDMLELISDYVEFENLEIEEP